MEITSTFLIILVFSTNLAIIKSQSYKSTTYVAGGHGAELGQFPYQASLRSAQNNNEHFCSGAIVSTHSIVTTAKCMIGRSKDDVFALVGSNTLSQQAKSLHLNKIIIHNYYNVSGNRENDIALLLTTETITYTQQIQPVYLPDQSYFGSNDLPPIKVAVSGWGKSEVSHY